MQKKIIDDEGVGIYFKSNYTYTCYAHLQVRNQSVINSIFGRKLFEDEGF